MRSVASELSIEWPLPIPIIDAICPAWKIRSTSFGGPRDANVSGSAHHSV